MGNKVELYRKYRPESYDDMVGNDAAVKALKAELEEGSHVFLLTGPAGCGKTTLARICAHELGAGELSINEINSANNRGVDTARDIMEKMRYNPSDGEVMVWIIDEVHKTTNDWQNAMLKPTEDTPSHVYFFLCTTDPQKLIAPLKTRCSEVKLKPFDNEQMFYLLKRTARAEKKKISEKVLDRIIDLADGSGRKGMKLLNKVLFLEDEADQVSALKDGGSEDAQETIDFCRALFQKNPSWASVKEVLAKVDMSEPENIRYAVLGYANAILMKSGKVNGMAVAALEAFSEPTYNTKKFGITLATLNYLADVGN
jgi:DNA polymerase-3 subunit gamma/tau